MPRRKLVTRGLLGVHAKHAPLTPRSAEDKTVHLMEVLQKETVDPYQWKETWQSFRRYGKGEGDVYGRRVMDPEVQKKARYVATVAHRAYLKGIVPQGKEWGYLRSAIAQVYTALES